jgi:hypothetical protein
MLAILIPHYYRLHLPAMYTTPSTEWICWMDSDTWFNPRWLDLPMEMMLADVPQDKVRSEKECGLYILKSI